MKNLDDRISPTTAIFIRYWSYYLISLAPRWIIRGSQVDQSMKNTVPLRIILKLVFDAAPEIAMKAIR